MFFITKKVKIIKYLLDKKNLYYYHTYNCFFYITIFIIKKTKYILAFDLGYTTNIPSIATHIL